MARRIQSKAGPKTRRKAPVSRAEAMQDERVQRVLATVDAIPKGKVASYGQVAEEAGLPRSARFVGSVLGRFVAKRGVPWHRVLGSDGTIRVQGGIARDQARLLRAEGVTVTNGRVKLRECGWDPDAD